MSKLAKYLWRLFVLGLVVILLLVVAANYGWLGYMPSLKELQNPSSAVASEVYADDGSLLGSYFIENRSNSKYSEISPNVFNALIATEDERFHKHSGIDGMAVMRAVFFLGKKGGGSTITQQLALNLFNQRSSNKLTRMVQKLKEWVMAVKLEKYFTKNEIITLYLNTVPFGGDIYGIKNASLTFYGKTPELLSVDEAAVLVGMLKANTFFNPHRNPDNSLRRRNVVIGQMLSNDYLSKEDAEKYKAKPIELNYRRISHVDGPAPYFRQVVEQEVKKWCRNNKNSDGEYYDIYKDGLKIYTTINPKMQQYAEEAVNEHLKTLQASFAAQPKIKNGTVWEKGKPKEVLMRYIHDSERYRYLKQEEGMSEKEILEEMNKPIPMTVFSWDGKNRKKDTIMSPIDSIKYMRAFLQSGFMAMDPYNGEIKAWVGGVNFEYFKYDHVNIGTKRQVGSVIKPLLYCLAVDHDYSPCSPVSTQPQMFAGMKSPYDAGGSKDGSISMSTALARSNNNASLYLLNQVGIGAFVDFVEKTGISSKVEKVPSVALGVSDISLYEMLWSYTMFANKGINTQPIFITKIEDKNGNVLQQFTPNQKEIINAETAYKMVLMMQGVTEQGTGKRLRYRYGLEGKMAGKTGTTNNQADAWYIGFTPQLLAGSWVGCDDRFLQFSSTAQGQGAAAALPVWAYFFKRIYDDKSLEYNSSSTFTEPPKFNNCGDLSGYMYTGNYDYPSNTGYDEDSERRNNDTSEPIEEIVPIDEW